MSIHILISGQRDIFVKKIGRVSSLGTLVLLTFVAHQLAGYWEEDRLSACSENCWCRTHATLGD